MQQFKISEEAYKQYRKKWLAIFIPSVFLITGGAVTLSFVSDKSDLHSLPFALGAVVLFLSFSIYNSAKKQKKLMLSYCITISEGEITREQLNTPGLTINFMEIKEIVKTRKGSFMIKGRTRTDLIVIPFIIDDHAAMEQQLATLAPITIRTKDPLYVKYRWVWAFLPLAMMAAVYLSNNKIIVGICGVALIGFFIWLFYEFRVSKNITTKARRRSWVYLAIAFSFGYLTYLKLSGRLS
ncbi:MAG TPA: hypothetical protein VNU72_13855 [Puia sp.]|jgi:hypothetical protein|nr:hypothetical protein [Puia sp.]